MKILYSPQRSDDVIDYSLQGEIITATHRGNTDIFDFTGLADGELQPYDEAGNPVIETTLDINPILDARRVDGVLSVTLLNFIGDDATEDERFPEWQEV